MSRVPARSRTSPARSRSSSARLAAPRTSSGRHSGSHRRVAGAPGRRLLRVRGGGVATLRRWGKGPMPSRGLRGERSGCRRLAAVGTRRKLAPCRGETGVVRCHRSEGPPSVRVRSGRKPASKRRGRLAGGRLRLRRWR
jgi:hypothetical protein